SDHAVQVSVGVSKAERRTSDLPARAPWSYRGRSARISSHLEGAGREIRSRRSPPSSPLSTGGALADQTLRESVEISGQARPSAGIQICTRYPQEADATSGWGPGVVIDGKESQWMISRAKT